MNLCYYIELIYYLDDKYSNIKSNNDDKEFFIKFCLGYHKNENEKRKNF